MADIITVEESAAIAMSYSVAPGYGFELVSFSLHLSAIPTTSEYFTVKKNTSAGAGFDTTPYEKDPSTFTAGRPADINVLFKPGEFVCESGDSVDFAYTNTDLVTYGLQVQYRRIS